MDEQDLRAGLMLGRYELLVPIAQGGTAAVWAARMKGPRGFEKIVAAKMMLAETLDDPDAEMMFLDEARTVARIRHPNVAEVLDLGEEQGVLFLVMEWVDGEPLTVIAREARALGGVPLAIALKIAKQACAGLHAAHELLDDAGHHVGLVHRDVSPQNVLVGHDGQVKVIDFGVAKAASNQLRTNVGQMKGKVAYMAPEQALGDPVDRRTDIFALGVVLYQLITGKHPFRGDNEFATLGRIRNKEPIEPPKRILPSLPDVVNDIIVKALSKPREGRYQTMVELARALEKASPTKESGNDDLAAFMKSILGGRAEKKRAAIREAIGRVDAKQPVEAQVPSAFTESRTLDSESFQQMLAALPSEARAADLFSPSSTPNPPSTSTPLPPSRSAPLPSSPAWGSPPVRAPMATPPPSSTPTPIPASVSNPLPPSTATPLLHVPQAEGRPSTPFEVPDFRRRRSPVALIAAAMAIVLGIALAIWSFAGGSSDAGSTSGEAPMKKAW
jgi:eukaryotic-like serine/threonine-protein kinase